MQEKSLDVVLEKIANLNEKVEANATNHDKKLDKFLKKIDEIDVLNLKIERIDTRDITREKHNKTVQWFFGVVLASFMSLTLYVAEIFRTAEREQTSAIQSTISKNQEQELNLLKLENMVENIRHEMDEMRHETIRETNTVMHFAK